MHFRQTSVQKTPYFSVDGPGYDRKRYGLQGVMGYQKYVLLTGSTVIDLDSRSIEGLNLIQVRLSF